MAKKKHYLSVTCEVNPNLSITLMNVREVMGHDDSLPFNAEVYVRKDNSILTHIANAWNHGWGGETNIDAISKDTKPIIDDLEAVVKTFIVDLGKYSFPANLPLVIELLACCAVDGNRGNYVKIEDLLKW